MTIRRHSDSSSALSSALSVASLSDTEEPLRQPAVKSEKPAYSAAASGGTSQPDGANMAMRWRENLKRSLSPEALKPRKRVRFSTTPAPTDVKMFELDSCLARLQTDVQEKFPARLKALLQENKTDASNWLFPDHHRFMVALCETVNDSIQVYCEQHDITSLQQSHQESFFQHALNTVGRLADESARDTPLNRFLRDADHKVYRELLQDSEKFMLRSDSTTEIFERVSKKLEKLAPGDQYRAGEMWKLCIDPQLIAHLKQKNIKTDSPLVGACLFEAEEDYLHNMALGWEFIVDAALDRRPLSFEMLVELNTILARGMKARGEDSEAGSDPDGLHYTSESSQYLLLEDHTLSAQGKEKLRQTVHALRERGLNITFERQHFDGRDDSPYHRVSIDVRSVKDLAILETWSRDCIKQFLKESKNLKGDALAECEFNLALDLNQAHVFSDRNIRTNHLLLNFLRLLRGEGPFMLSDPNWLDGLSAPELNEKSKAARHGKAAVQTPQAMPPKPATLSRAWQQMQLVNQVRHEQKKAVSLPKRNVPESRAVASISKQGHDKVDNQTLLSTLPDGIWEKAQERARQDGPVEGVTLKTRDGKPHHYLVNKATAFPIRITIEPPDRDPQFVRSLAIALRMAAEAAREEEDQTLIAGLPPGIWEQARNMTANTENRGVFRLDRGGIPCWRAKMGAEVLGDFSMLLGRSEERAQMLALALRLRADRERNQSKENVYDALIAELDPRLMELARRVPKDEPLPGISLVPGAQVTTYQLNLFGNDGKKTRYPINEKYDADDVRAMAIVLRSLSEPDPCADAIASLPDGMLDRAKEKLLEEPDLEVKGVKYNPPTTGKIPHRAMYSARWFDAEKRDNVAKFYSSYRYSIEEVHAIALAVKWAGDEARQSSIPKKKKTSEN